MMKLILNQNTENTTQYNEKTYNSNDSYNNDFMFSTQNPLILLLVVVFIILFAIIALTFH